jgi:hypothetical protein
MMSLPPPVAFRPPGHVLEWGRLLGRLPYQLLRSWHIMYFQLPLLPERSASWLPPLLWRRWSPVYDAEDDLRHVDAAIGTPESWRAALDRIEPRCATPDRRRGMLNYIGTGCRRRSYRACTCMVATMAASHRLSRAGQRECFPPEAISPSLNTPDTSCSSTSRTELPS